MSIVFPPYSNSICTSLTDVCIFVQIRQNDASLGKKIYPLIGFDPSLFPFPLSHARNLRNYYLGMFTEIAHSQNVFSLHTILQLYHSNNLDTQKIRSFMNSNSFISLIHSTKF